MSNETICKRPSRSGRVSDKDRHLFAVSPHVLVEETAGEFSLYIKQGARMVLYADKGETFTESHRERVEAMGVQELFVELGHREAYREYLRRQLSTLLNNEAIPCPVRADIFYQATSVMARDIFESSLSGTGGKVRFQRIETIIRESMDFFTRPEAMREISRFVADSPDIYAHGVAVMVLTASMLSLRPLGDRRLSAACSVGALLHDIGKTRLPASVFERHPDVLNDDERKQLYSHPAMGVSACACLPLPQEALHCILFHHEQDDGGGYPSKAEGNMLPDYTRVLALCNAYDRLVRRQPWREGMTPFEALTHLRSVDGSFAPDLVNLLVSVLNRAGMV